MPTFSGDPCDVIDYLDDVARLCEACGAEKIKYAPKYVSHEVEKLWCHAMHYCKANWDTFGCLVMRFYPEVDADVCHTCSALQRVIERQVSILMTSRVDLGVYLREFESISLYWLRKEWLSESERSHWFLDGFSPKFKSALLHRLSLSDLNHHPEDPWTTDKILLQAKCILMAQECALITCAEPQPPKPRIQQPAHHFCYFCGQDGHIRAQCRQCAEYLQVRKCELASRHIVLPGWSEIPREVLGRTLKDHINNWHALWAEAPKSRSMCAIPSLPSAPNLIPAHELLAQVLDHSGPFPPLPHLSLLTLGDEPPPKCQSAVSPCGSAHVHLRWLTEVPW